MQAFDHQEYVRALQLEREVAYRRPQFTVRAQGPSPRSRWELAISALFGRDGTNTGSRPAFDGKDRNHLRIPGEEV